MPRPLAGTGGQITFRLQATCAVHPYDPGRIRAREILSGFSRAAEIHECIAGRADAHGPLGGKLMMLTLRGKRSASLVTGSLVQPGAHIPVTSGLASHLATSIWPASPKLPMT